MAKKIIYLVLETICFLVVPCVLVLCQYSSAQEVSTQYKVTTSGIIALLIIFIFVKNIWLKQFLTKVNNKLTNIEVAQLSAVDENIIKSLKREYRIFSVIQFIINSFPAILIFILMLATIKIVEAGAIKLYGVLVFSGLSMLLGIVVHFIQIFTFKLEHEKKGDK